MMQHVLLWRRLGVVISAIWIVAGGGYVAVQWHGETEAMASSAWDTRNNGDWAVVGQESFFFRCTSKSVPKPADAYLPFLRQAEPTCKPKLLQVACLLLLPIVLAWGFSLLGVRVVAWVRGGYGVT